MSSSSKESVAKTSGKSTEQKKTIDLKWLVIGLLIALGLMVGVVANIVSSGNDENDITGLIDIDNGDLKINWEKYSSFDVELTDSLEISESGVYHLTGAINNGMVNVNVESEGDVKLILDNVSITNSNGPAIACLGGNNLVIELVGENTLKDGAKYSTDWDEDVNGVIYSKADLTLRGDGTLNITANYQDAIVGKDDLKLDGGVYNIVAADDGIRGKDSVYVVSGDYNINVRGDAIGSTNDTDAGKGFVLIENGNVDIAAGDDGIHAIRVLVIQDGKINITKSYEGIESQKIIVNGGSIDIVASDDGINAGGSSDNTSTTARNAFDADENCEIIINAGNIYVNASGDGIDSNGYIYFNGGEVSVDGPTNNGNGALDAGIGIIMNGGEVVAVGSSGMAENLGTTSSVCSISVYLTASQSSGTIIEIKNKSNETIVSHTAAKSFTHAAIGSEDFVLGETYTIYINGVKYQDFTIESVVTVIGSSNSNTNMMPMRSNERR